MNKKELSEEMKQLICQIKGHEAGENDICVVCGKYAFQRGKKIIWKDGLPHRMRRGKLVRIPDKWFGQVPYPQRIRKRPSKRPEGN